MATKKSTPKKTSAKANASSIARNANKGFTAGLTSTLGPDPKPYNRRQATPASQKKTSTPKTSNAMSTDAKAKVYAAHVASPEYKAAKDAAYQGYRARTNDARKEDHQKQMASRKTSTAKGGITGMKRLVHTPSEETLKATNTAASTARGQRLNNSASMPKGNTAATPKSSARAKVGDAYIASDGVRNTLTGELISKPKTNSKRFLPVDHGTVDLPAGATSAKYDSYKDKYVPVFTSGDKKKNSKKDLPRDYGL